MSSSVVIMSGLARLLLSWEPVGPVSGVVSDWSHPLHSASCPVRLMLRMSADPGLSAFVVGMDWSLCAGGW